jgi:hypothetical protein
MSYTEIGAHTEAGFCEKKRAVVLCLDGRAEFAGFEDQRLRSRRGIHPQHREPGILGGSVKSPEEHGASLRDETLFGISADVAVHFFCVRPAPWSNSSRA